MNEINQPNGTVASMRASEEFASESGTLGLPWRLVLFSAFLFVLAIFVYLGIRFGYHKYLESQINAYDEKMNQLATEVSESDQESFVNFYSQLVNLKKALEATRFSSNIFSFLERTTLSTVYFDEAKLKQEDNMLELGGEALSTEVLVQQLQVWNDAPEVVKVVLSDTSLGLNRVSFNGTIIFKPEFFNEPR